MEGVNSAQLGQFLSRAAKGSLSGGEAKIIFALLKAALVDGDEGIEYNLYNFQMLTDMQKQRVDTNLGKLLKRHVIRLNRAKNKVILNRIDHNVVVTNSNNSGNSNNFKTTTVGAISFKPDTGNPVSRFVQEIGLYMPSIKLTGKAYLIEMANGKRLYQKFFSFDKTSAGSLLMMQDYLEYKLETDEWFRTKAELPVTMLYRGVDRYLGAIKPKSRDDLAFEQTLGKPLKWYADGNYWGARKGKDESGHGMVAK